jgi:hypothetical protein
MASRTGTGLPHCKESDAAMRIPLRPPPDALCCRASPLGAIGLSIDACDFAMNDRLAPLGPAVRGELDDAAVRHQRDRVQRVPPLAKE